MIPILEKICGRRREDLISRGVDFSLSLPIENMRIQGESAADDTLRYIQDSFFLIGECKKSSPSAGILVDDYDPVSLSQGYEESGARGISVLTEGPHFGGCLEDLKSVTSSVNLPALCKDFIIHPVQIDDAAKAGARLILLIAACLTDQELVSFNIYARNRGLLTLTEVHTEKEVNRAVALDQPLIGINNRDLNTFKVDLNVSLNLIQFIPKGTPVISESGIRSSEDILNLKSSGFAGALVGTHLVSAKNPSAAMGALAEAVV